MDDNKYLLFRLVPTMQCNYRCSYCFLPGEEKEVSGTMFDLHSPEEWVRAMRNFAGYEVEFYCWGGEPFLIGGTYELVKGWTAYDHVLGGSRLDTNMAFAEKIARLCPTDKVKLNCSWHTQYHSYEQIFRKVKLLNDLGMVGMLNFVASPHNLKVLENDYRMSLDDLVGRFDDIGVFVNIAADFALVNGKDPSTCEDYKRLLLRYVSPEDWKQLRCEKSSAHCDANRHFFTIHPNGDLTPCLSGRVSGNFFEGTLEFPATEVCHNQCPSIVAYPFRRDNDFVFRGHLPEYVARNREYRASCTGGRGLRVPVTVREPAAPKPPRVSVVLPTYNQADYLPLAVESVLGQTVGDFELIIVNDGSTDGTPAYLDTLTDPRIVVIHQENRRLPGALNAGFTRARGDLFTWISSDNYCAPFFLEALASALDAHPEAGFVSSAFAWIDGDGEITGVHRGEELNYRTLLQHNPGIASFMYRRECQEKVGFYDTDLEGVEDWDMWLRIIEEYRAVYVPEVLYYYRSHGESMTARQQEQIGEAGWRIFEKAVARKENRLRLTELFPAISSLPDPETAKSEAFFHFGTEFLVSPFCHLETACSFLERAVFLSGGAPAATANLAVAYARAGRRKEALDLIAALKGENAASVRGNGAMVEEACRAGSVATADLPVIRGTAQTLDILKAEQGARLVHHFTDQIAN